jgi:uncharacterized protein YidB (DUF937 family)
LTQSGHSIPRIFATAAAHSATTHSTAAAHATATATAGSVLSGGLNDLLKQFQQSGQGEVAQSWIGSGPNKAVSPNDLANALGVDRINTLAAFSGMSRDDLLNGLSQQLPDVVDQLTPDGRLPTEQEAARLV